MFSLYDLIHSQGEIPISQVDTTQNAASALSQGNSALRSSYFDSLQDETDNGDPNDEELEDDMASITFPKRFNRNNQESILAEIPSSSTKLPVTDILYMNSPYFQFAHDTGGLKYAPGYMSYQTYAQVEEPFIPLQKKVLQKLWNCCYQVRDYVGSLETMKVLSEVDSIASSQDLYQLLDIFRSSPNLDVDFTTCILSAHSMSMNARYLTAEEKYDNLIVFLHFLLQEYTPTSSSTATASDVDKNLAAAKTILRQKVAGRSKTTTTIHASSENNLRNDKTNYQTSLIMAYESIVLSLEYVHLVEQIKQSLLPSTTSSSSSSNIYQMHANLPTMNEIAEHPLKFYFLVRYLFLFSKENNLEVLLTKSMNSTSSSSNRKRRNSIIKAVSQRRQRQQLRQSQKNAKLLQRMKARKRKLALDCDDDEEDDEEEEGDEEDEEEDEGSDSEEEDGNGEETIDRMEDNDDDDEDEVELLIEDPAMDYASRLEHLQKLQQQVINQFKQLTTSFSLSAYTNESLIWFDFQTLYIAFLLATEATEKATEQLYSLQYYATNALPRRVSVTSIDQQQGEGEVLYRREIIYQHQIISQLLAEIVIFFTNTIQEGNFLTEITRLMSAPYHRSALFASYGYNSEHTLVNNTATEDDDQVASPCILYPMTSQDLYRDWLLFECRLLTKESLIVSVAKTIEHRHYEDDGNDADEQASLAVDWLLWKMLALLLGPLPQRLAIDAPIQPNCEVYHFLPEMVIANQLFTDISNINSNNNTTGNDFMDRRRSQWPRRRRKKNGPQAEEEGEGQQPQQQEQQEHEEDTFLTSFCHEYQWWMDMILSTSLLDGLSDSILYHHPATAPSSSNNDSDEASFLVNLERIVQEIDTSNFTMITTPKVCTRLVNEKLLTPWFQLDQRMHDFYYDNVNPHRNKAAEDAATPAMSMDGRVNLTQFEISPILAPPIQLTDIFEIQIDETMEQEMYDFHLFTRLLRREKNEVEHPADILSLYMIEYCQEQRQQQQLTEEKQQLSHRFPVLDFSIKKKCLPIPKTILQDGYQRKTSREAEKEDIAGTDEVEEDRDEGESDNGEEDDDDEEDENSSTADSQYTSATSSSSIISERRRNPSTATKKNTSKTKKQQSQPSSKKRQAKAAASTKRKSHYASVDPLATYEHQEEECIILGPAYLEMLSFHALVAAHLSGSPDNLFTLRVIQTLVHHAMRVYTAVVADIEEDAKAAVIDDGKDGEINPQQDADVIMDVDQTSERAAQKNETEERKNGQKEDDESEGDEDKEEQSGQQSSTKKGKRRGKKKATPSNNDLITKQLKQQRKQQQHQQVMLCLAFLQEHGINLQRCLAKGFEFACQDIPMNQPPPEYFRLSEEEIYLMGNPSGMYDPIRFVQRGG